jgi:hypothetical protein
MSPPPRPLSLSRNFLLLWLHAGGRAFAGRRGIVLGLLVALPVLIAWLQVKNDPHVGTTDFVGIMLMFVFQFVVPLGGLFLGVAALGDEIEGRTLTYLFTRPQPRPLVFLARYLGLAVAFALLLVGAVAITSFVYASRVPLTARQAAGTAGVAALGFVVYAALFAALRVFVQRALFVGFVLGFIFEGGVSKLPDSGISRCSVWHHLALLETRLFGGRVAASGDLRDVLGGIAADETAGGSLAVLGSVLLLSLAAAAWRVRSQETRLANAPT